MSEPVELDTTKDTTNTGTPIAETGLRSFDESLPMALLRAREAIMRRFRPVLGDHDVTEQQWRVLRALDDADGSVTVGELSDRTFLLGPSLSRMLVTLDDRGLITRSADQGDARRSQVAISRSGRQLVAAIAPHSETVYAEIGAQLGPAELEQLYDLLRRTAAIKETR
jgi:homoprotocatechuate degradation regulator HpaR